MRYIRSKSNSMILYSQTSKKKFISILKIFQIIFFSKNYKKDSKNLG